MQSLSVEDFQKIEIERLEARVVALDLENRALTRQLGKAEKKKCWPQVAAAVAVILLAELVSVLVLR